GLRGGLGHAPRIADDSRRDPLAGLGAGGGSSLQAHDEINGRGRRRCSRPRKLTAGLPPAGPPPGAGPLPSAGDERRDDDERAGIAARKEPAGREHRSEDRARSGPTAEATSAIERGAQRARSRAVSTDGPPRTGSAEAAAYADRF